MPPPAGRRPSTVTAKPRTPGSRRRRVLEMRRSSTTARAAAAMLGLVAAAAVVAAAARVPLSRATAINARSAQTPTTAVFMVLAGMGVVMVGGLVLLLSSGRRRKDDPPEREPTQIEAALDLEARRHGDAVRAGGCADRRCGDRYQTGAPGTPVRRRGCSGARQPVPLGRAPPAAGSRSRPGFRGRCWQSPPPHSRSAASCCG